MRFILRQLLNETSLNVTDIVIFKRVKKKKKSGNNSIQYDMRYICGDGRIHDGSESVYVVRCCVFIFVKASSRNFLLVSLEWPLLINFLV